MSPRAYAMTARRSAVESTRHRIVLAAARLHARKGALRSSWDDIAAEAGVSRATVYHHFPSLSELVPACAQLAFELADVPSREQALTRFAAMPTPELRLENFVRETCRCYAGGAIWLRAAWRERDLVPEMGAAVRRLQRALRVLLEAALDGVHLNADSMRAVVALLDFPFWDALHSAGTPPAAIPDRLLQLALAVISDGGRTR